MRCSLARSCNVPGSGAISHCHSMRPAGRGAVVQSGLCTRPGRATFSRTSTAARVPARHGRSCGATRNASVRPVCVTADPQYHSGIHLSEVAAYMASMPEVQRLRRLKQLGVGEQTFPTANHTRFEHSLGVAALAKRLGHHLAKQQPELGISSTDLMTLELAGLLHDVGHGPFSHMFETEVLPRSGTHGWKHENMSLVLVERIVHRYNVNTASSSLPRVSADMLQDIKDIIVGGPNNPRFRERPWMLEVVANHISGIDVDRLDYLSRDARNVAHRAQWRFDELLEGCKVVDGHICWQASTVLALWQVFAARFELHQQVYMHPTTKAAEALVADALVAANALLNLQDCCKSADAFLLLDDNQLLAAVRGINQQQAEADPLLAQARHLLCRFDMGQLYLLVGELEVPAQWASKAAWDGQEQKQGDAAQVCMPGKRAIATAHELVACWPSSSSSGGSSSTSACPEAGDIWVSCVAADYGSKDKNPMDGVQVVGGCWPAFRPDRQVTRYMHRFVRVYIKRLFMTQSDAQVYITAVQEAMSAWTQMHFGEDAMKGLYLPPAQQLAPSVVCRVSDTE